MAHLVAFHYHPGSSVLHRIDARLKLPLFLLLVADVLHSSTFGLCALTLFAAVCLVDSRVPAARILRELRLFAALLLLMFVARSFGAADRGAGPFPAVGAIEAAGLLVWRLALLVLMGTLLAATTRAAHIQSAIAWYLRPFPFLPGGRIATMIGLTISLIPLVFDTYRDVSDAQGARCVHGFRRPVRRLRRTVVPLMLKTFGRADALAAAMDSRCYTDLRTFAALRAHPSDWTVVLVVLCVVALTVVLDRLL